MQDSSFVVGRYVATIRYVRHTVRNSRFPSKQQQFEISGKGKLMDDKQYTAILMLLLTILSYVSSGTMQTAWLVLALATAVIYVVHQVADWIIDD